MSMQTGHWTVSSNEEEGYSETAPTREQAIADYVFGYAPGVGETIYVGRVKLPELPALNIQYAVESACEDAEWPECVGERFLESIRYGTPSLADLERRTAAMFAEWASANSAFGGSFIVDEIKPYTVTQADVDASLARERAREAAAS